MDTYVYLYLFLFLICIYLVNYFNDKISAKFPKAYVKSDLQYYPTNYNSSILNTSENKYMKSLKSELMLYSLALQYILEPFIKIIYYPKKILLKYIHKMV
mgnify:FL=1|jgi:hypothetical protein|uniref:Uncharacterized protein n=1 Tax=viral metagenome TaxID=1070528 RepID=A0A6C0IR84_9ZZZZ